MVFSFILNDWNVVAFLQSLDSEFQTMPPPVCKTILPMLWFLVEEVLYLIRNCKVIYLLQRILY